VAAADFARAERDLAAAGWSVGRFENGLRLNAKAASTALFAAVTAAAGPAAARVKVVQPGLSRVFQRLIDEGRNQVAEAPGAVTR
jgi:hypothetical protein